MTTPTTCHYDRDLATRIHTSHHDPDCPTHNGGPCPGRWDGCQPCPRPHCTSCSYRHLNPHDPTHPRTCPHCIGQTREDLHEIRWLCRHLRWHAARAGRDGRLLAAAPIPGGDAQVLIGPTSGDGDDLIWSPTLNDDHHAKDVIPPLLPLATWDTRTRTHLGHDTGTATVAAITGYLADHLTHLAQDPDYDWDGLATDLAALRRQLERVLHDESEPERGVSCFECGDQLVRRFGKPQPCRHRTPGRDHLAAVKAEAQAAAEHVANLRAQGEEPNYAELRAARRRPTSAEETAARRPCDACTNSRAGQGGLEDPSVGQSWECPSCRKRYSPGEYAAAVRRDLLTTGPGGDGWTFVTMAAEAASTQTGLPIAQGTVRKWAERGRVASCCRLVIRRPAGREDLVVSQSPLRLVFWPDVADAAADLVRRAGELEAEKAARAAEEKRLRELMDSGVTPAEAASKMGMHPNRLRAILDRWNVAAS